MPPPASAPTIERLQRGGARGGARAVAEERTGERVRDLDQLAAEAEAGVDHDAGERTSRRIRSLSAYWVCKRVVAHRQPGTDQQEEDKQRVGGDQADLPQARDLRIRRQLRASTRTVLPTRSSIGLSASRTRLLNQSLIALLDPARQIPESRMARLVAADSRRRASASSMPVGGGPTCTPGPVVVTARRGRAAGGRCWSCWTRAARRSASVGNEQDDDQCRDEDCCAMAAVHPPTIFWMIVTITGANNAKA